MHILLSFILLVQVSLVTDQPTVNEQPRKYAIGDEAHGGIIFYLDPSGEHGLVAAPKDLSLGKKDRMVWGCVDMHVGGARLTAIGTGDKNTKDIVESCTKGETAAEACYKLKLNGYSDWYLPSKGELDQMFKNSKKAKLKMKKAGYWSSSGNGIGNAWVQTFGMGYQFVSAKYGSHRVRAIRKF